MITPLELLYFSSTEEMSVQDQADIIVIILQEKVAQNYSIYYDRLKSFLRNFYPLRDMYLRMEGKMFY